MEKPGMWGGLVTLANGWQMALPDMPDGTTLPITVEARRTTTGEEV
jgi:nitrogen fixation protein NifT